MECCRLVYPFVAHVEVYLYFGNDYAAEINSSYQRIEEVGAGGYGIVYSSVRTADGRPMALSVLNVGIELKDVLRKQSPLKCFKKDWKFYR